MPNEVGRELLASDLQPYTVVLVGTDGHAVMVTLWVAEVSADRVRFYSGEVQYGLVGHRVGDALLDGDGKVLRVYEYLGEI